MLNYPKLNLLLERCSENSGKAKFIRIVANNNLLPTARSPSGSSWLLKTFTGQTLGQ